LLWLIAIGAAYFLIITIVKRFVPYTYKQGLIPPVVIAVGFMFLSIAMFSSSNSSMSFQFDVGGALIFFIVVSIVLATYSLLWYITLKISEHRKSLKTFKNE
jgi:membrane protein CcdC involved in cytochrome C biogenesis